MNDVLNIFMYFENRIKDQATLDKCSVDVIGSDVLGTSLLWMWVGFQIEVEKQLCARGTGGQRSSQCWCYTCAV